MLNIRSKHTILNMAANFEILILHIFVNLKNVSMSIFIIQIIVTCFSHY